MSGVSPCPDSRDLEQFLLGQVSDAEAERLEQHLTQCNRCDHSLYALTAEDPLVRAMRQVYVAEAPEPPNPRPRRSNT